MKVKEITKITLYLKGCYGCDRFDKFGQLRKFILKNQLPLDILTIKRVELNPEWVLECERFDKELPVVAIEFNDGEPESMEAMTYEEFLEQINRKVAKRRKRKHTQPSSDGAMSKDGNDQSESSAPTTSDSIERLREPDAAPESEVEDGV
jgi:hypothetical protein